MRALELRVAVPQDVDVVASLLGQLPALDEVVVVLAIEQEAVGLVLVTLRPTPYWDGSLARLEELYV